MVCVEVKWIPVVVVGNFGNHQPYVGCGAFINTHTLTHMHPSTAQSYGVWSKKFLTSVIKGNLVNLTFKLLSGSLECLENHFDGVCVCV